MVKSLPANAGDIRDLDLIPGPERSPGRGNDNPLQYFFFNYLFLYLFLAVRVLVAICKLSLVVASGVYSLVADHGLLIAVASVIVAPGSRERRPQ